MTEHNLPFNRRSRGVAAAIFLGIALVLIGAGYLYYRVETAEITRDKCQTLASISELKAQQISQWRHERLAEAQRAAGDQFLVAVLEEYLRAPGDEGLRSKLASCLRQEIFSDEGHAGSLMFDTGSNILAVNDDAGTDLSEDTRLAMREALATGKVGFSDFYFGPTGVVHLDIVAPVKDEAGNLLGGVILRHEAEDFVFPMIESWPVPTHSAEIILVERDGDDALFVNGKGHKPLTRRVPLSQTDAPSVQMVLGKRGIFEGRDYRGVEVVGDLVAVPESPWFIEVKMDAEEIFAEARDRATLIFLVVGLLVLMSGGLIMAFYRNRQTRMLRGLLTAEKQRAEAFEAAHQTESRHRDIIQTSVDGYCMVDSKANILEVNDAFCKMLGYSEQELLSMHVSDVEAAMSHEEAVTTTHQITVKGSDRFETRQRHKDGRIIDVEVSIQCRSADGMLVAFHHDITERKRIVQSLKTSEAKFREVIDSSPVAMAGIDARMNAAFLNPEFVHAFGYTVEDIPTLSLWWEKAYPDPVYRKSLADAWIADLERTKRTGEKTSPAEVVVRCKDGTDKNVLISTSLSVNPLEDGYVVSLVDITERKQAEDALREAEKIAREKTALLKSIIESPQSIVIFALDCDYRYTEFTAAHRQTIKTIWGAEIEIGMNMLDIIGSPADREKAKRNFDRVLQGECLLEVEEYGDPPNRSFYENRYSPVMDARGKVIGLTVFVIDISDRRRAEENLIRSEQLLRESQETANIGHYLNDLTTGLWESSPTLDRIFGIGPDFVRDTDGWGSLMHPDDREKTVSYFLHIIANREPFRMDYRIIRPSDGELRWMAGYGDFEYDSSGKAVRLVGCIQDITERKMVEEELEKREARFRSYFEMPLHGNCVTSIEKGWLEVNDRLCEMLGYTREEFVSKTWPEMTHPDDLAVDVEQFDLLLAGEIEKYKLEKRFIRKDGTFVWTMISVCCVRKSDGGADYLVCVIEEISRRKHDEQLLEEHSLALRKTNEDLNQSLHAARELAVKAESAARAKSQFLAVMSHELRTPLNGVLGFSELLATTSLDAEQQDFARTIRDSGEHLLSIVNDILDFSSIEKGTTALELAPITLSKLVESSSLTVRKTASDKGLELRCEIAPGVPEQITGDERRIRQILLNLLGNAVKFTSRGSAILRVSPASVDGAAFLDFAVADTGPGISPETLTCLFQPFTQGDATLHRRFDGTGLGLAISQKLAEAMGGTITVDSAPGKGSTFTFRFPIGLKKPVVRTPAPKAAAPDSSTFGGLVLVVDDDGVNRKLAGNLLRSLGCRVEFAANGQEAVEACGKGKFAAVFMDMQMPVMDGIEATKLIRSQENGSGRIPIIALTANVMPGDREHCFAAGMDGFLTKPFKKAEFAAALASHLAPKDKP
ncbi:MAG: PAS domain S-box protein [Verrucomicrobiaceae bacterium]|nr:MAG: PAS domain S-box protein [Verrucomicrobiaceae bacterium]